MTPEAAAREQQRVTLLLNMNSELLYLASQMQAEGKAGTENQSVPPKPEELNGASASKSASKEYIE